MALEFGPFEEVLHLRVEYQDKLRATCLFGYLEWEISCKFTFEVCIIFGSPDRRALKFILLL